MEQVLAEEASVNSKLENLEERRNCMGSRLIDLRSIRAPGDLAHFHAQIHREALQRNAELLQELDIATGKLHTRALLPMQQTLLSLRQAVLKTPKNHVLAQSTVP